MSTGTIDRVTLSGCTYFDSNRCVSCSLLPQTYERQLRLKEQALRQRFDQAGFSEIEVASIVQAPQQFATRSKAKMAVGGSIENPVIGYVPHGFEVRELANCPLYPDPITKVLTGAQLAITKEQITPFNIEKNEGELKHLIVWYSERTGEGYLRAVVRSTAGLSKASAFLRRLSGENPAFTLLSINVQPQRTAIIEGPHETIISDRSLVYEQYGDLRFPISPRSFTQVTPTVATALYERAAERISAHKPERMLDLFCGIGGFSLFAARVAGSVLGIEVIEEAVGNATLAAKLNAVNNCVFRTSDAEQFLAAGEEEFDLVLVNPPRRGLGPKLSALVANAARQAIIYSSCNPETLCDDVKVLSSQFIARRAYPFDMFPNTPHLEVLVELVRR